MRNTDLSEATEIGAGGRAAALWNDVLRFSMREAGVAVGLVLIVLFFCFTAPYFATPENFLKIFVQIAINTVLASGMTFVILTGGIDLSVGSVLALCTVVGALIMTDKDSAGVRLRSAGAPRLHGRRRRSAARSTASSSSNGRSPPSSSRSACSTSRAARRA